LPFFDSFFLANAYLYLLAIIFSPCMVADREREIAKQCTQCI
jgi:hypothetical protein